ncbi:hypothetical protein TIFTF001_002743 [Ficus carica]|uniref:Uncharacterized protein n=1 Tax=Ficus carica TaxID=3494 RepID=A0AA87ZW83_FICCA|nr:hypothetical protein TIFTF001_002743 [Ficus carica]
MEKESRRHRRAVEHGLRQAKLLSVNPSPRTYRGRTHCRRAVNDGGNALCCVFTMSFVDDRREPPNWLFYPCRRFSLSVLGCTSECLAPK